MKSIIEEAPSILKAIEKAWARAGNPREFSVKIFEDSQRNFFGMTTKQAKVGVFFEIEPIQSESTTNSSFENRRPAKQAQPKNVPYGQTSKTTHAEHRNTAKPTPKNSYDAYDADQNAPFAARTHEQENPTEHHQEPKKQRIAWNDDMLTAVSMWLNDLLEKSDLGFHKATLTVLDNRLIVLFEKPLFDDPVKASDLYRSLSYLLIGMVRSKFKKEFRFLKIVLTDGQRDRDNES